MAKIRPPFTLADRYLVLRPFTYDAIPFVSGDAFVPKVIGCTEEKLRKLYEKRNLELVPGAADNYTFSSRIKALLGDNGTPIVPAQAAASVAA